MTAYRRWGKRVLDITVVVVALPLLAPLMLGVALLVYWHLGRPLLYVQQRPGLGGRPFTLYKFRTMLIAYDATGQLLPDGARLTRFGRMLRATSLDELPEIWNVMKGEMSLVGPRPLLMQYLALYSPEQAQRHNVRPGLTGWAQVNGRNAITWEQKFSLDVWYVRHCSLRLDLLILWRTLRHLLRPRGINQAGEATAEPFRGTRGRA